MSVKALLDFLEKQRGGEAKDWAISIAESPKPKLPSMAFRVGKDFGTAISAWPDYTRQVHMNKPVNPKKISKQHVAFHKHDGFPEHPVAVKYHERYFQSNIDDQKQDQRHVEHSMVVSLHPRLSADAISGIKNKLNQHQNYLKSNLSIETKLLWENLANENKTNVNAMKRRVANDLQPLVTKSDVWIAVPSNRLISIFKSERFKSVSETKMMSAASGVKLDEYLNAREKTEDKIFGPSISNQRPIYGFLSDNSNGRIGERKTEDGGFKDVIDMYGKVRIKLKPYIKEVSTITFGDSLNMNGFGETKTIPYFINNIGGEVILPYTYKLFTSVADAPNYVEAQIHGGVTVDDIEKVVFYDEPMIDAINELNRLSIPYSVEKRTEAWR